MEWKKFKDEKPEDGQLVIIKVKNYVKEPWFYSIGFWHAGRERFIFPSLNCPQCEENPILAKHRPLFGTTSERMVLWKVFDEEKINDGNY